MDLKKQSEDLIGLREGFHHLREKFPSEIEFEKNLIEKVPFLIKRMYGLDVTNIEQQKVFDLNCFDLYKIRVDLFVSTSQGKSFVIESKNPVQEKSELILGISQIMSYDFILKKMGIDCDVILATSVFDFKYLEFMAHFNLKYDIIVNNEKQVAFWINEWK